MTQSDPHRIGAPTPARRGFPDSALSLTLALALGLATVTSLTACGWAEQGDPQVLKISFQRQTDPATIEAGARKVAQFLEAELGMPVEFAIPTGYGMTVQALASKQADVAFLSAMPFLLAREAADAELLLAEVRVDLEGNERTDYDSVFVVRADSDIDSLEKLIERAGELRFAFTSSTSTSGYIYPRWRLVREGLLEPGQEPDEVFRSVTYGGGYTQALHQVLGDRADVCAVSFYTVEGETADHYLASDDRRRLRVLDRTPGVPTHLIAARGGLSDDLKDRLREALLKLSQEHPDLLQDVYGARGLRRVDPEQHVQAAIDALQAAGIQARDIVQPPN